MSQLHVSESPEAVNGQEVPETNGQLPVNGTAVHGAPRFAVQAVANGVPALRVPAEETVEELIARLDKEAEEAERLAAEAEQAMIAEAQEVGTETGDAERRRQAKEAANQYKKEVGLIN